MPPTVRRGFLTAFLPGITLTVLASGCLQNEGIDPPSAKLNFPVAIELVNTSDDPAAPPSHIVVVNTNFDLGYNAATVQSYDLAAVESAIDTACVVAGIDGELCSIVPVESGEESGTRGNVLVVAEPNLLTSEVRIGSNAEGLALSPSRRRLYIPVRSDADITRVELDANGVLSCSSGDTSFGHACDGAHRTTDKSLASARDISLPIEPLDVHVGSLSDFGMPAAAGDYLAVAHRAGAASFFAIPAGTETPILTDVLQVTTATVNTTFVTTTFDPTTRRFWFPTGNGGLFVRASVTLAASTTDPTEAEWLRAQNVGLTDVDVGSSSASIREVVIDPRVGTDHEGRFYAVALRPAALLVGRLDPGSNAMALDAVLPLGSQPTRARFVELDGHMVAFVSCYGSRDVYAYDVDNARLLTIVRGTSGPFEIAIDASRELMFVTDFRVSVIRLFDLAPLVDCLELTTSPATEPVCSPRARGMLGIPSTVEELR